STVARFVLPLGPLRLRAGARACSAGDAWRALPRTTGELGNRDARALERVELPPPCRRVRPGHGFAGRGTAGAACVPDRGRPCGAGTGTGSGALNAQRSGLRRGEPAHGLAGWGRVLSFARAQLVSDSRCRASEARRKVEELPLQTELFREM